MKNTEVFLYKIYLFRNFLIFVVSDRKSDFFEKNKLNNSRILKNTHATFLKCGTPDFCNINF